MVDQKSDATDSQQHDRRRSLRLSQRPVLIVPPPSVQKVQKKKKTPMKVRRTITRRAMAKLAAAVGVKRLRVDVHEKAEEFLVDFIDDVVYDIVQYCRCARRKTILLEDVQNALKRRGLSVYC
ncbi:unnamed protein product [Nippostrongylus brasiliensis]|uniref:Histone H4 n=1 Tax=Nippostrongylus brasiliensis TaxID=27835 RepID=A0A0N4YGB7_NIPBR|nr:hypothetical protein Q1695_008837 [Nippostrongylus brasiliensis]VDL79441.1 unnamed protein product [Nippostrongylus brasiliensis]